MNKKKHNRKVSMAGGFSLSLLLVCCTFTLGWGQSTSASQESDILVSHASQEAPVSAINQLISISFKDAALLDALKQVTGDIGMELSYSKEVLPINKKVTADFTDTPVNEVMYFLLEGTQLRYAISEKGSLVLFEYFGEQQKSSSLKHSLETVSGLVTDAESGESLPGVNLIVKGTNKGTSTDAEGGFELDVPSLQDTLVVSFVGYQTREVPIDGRMELEIQLSPQAISGEEVVVVGYGEQQERDLTSSVTSVSGEDIAKVPAANMGNALFGTSGLQVKQRSGRPGQDEPSIFVRGIGSLSAGRSQPIYVIDGTVIQDARTFTQLDPDNIASVSVLKDASATAVYGVEGANGVIVVETKRGRPGKMDISVNSSAGMQAPIVKHKIMDSYNHALLFNEAQMNDGVDSNNVRFGPDIVEAFRTGSHPLIYPDIDWWDYLTKPRAFQSRTNISISGGNDDVQYFVAGGYLKQDGFMKAFEGAETFAEYEPNPTYDRYNLRSNLDINVTPSTQLLVNATGRVGSRVQIIGGETGRRGFNEFYAIAPWSSPGFVDGVKARNHNYIPGATGGGTFLPEAGGGYTQYIESGLNLQLAGTQQLDAITEGLQLQLKGTYNADFIHTKVRSSNARRAEILFRTDVDPSAPGDSSVVLQYGSRQPSTLGYDESFEKDRDWYVEARLQYNRDFGPHGVEALLLAGQRKRYYPSQYRGIPRRLINNVGRINYNFNDRYLLELSMGYNGSENFTEGRRFGFFPAVSGGWILTNEPYMPELPFLSFLKLRASYGLVGNDTGIGRFLYLPDEYNASCGGYSLGHAVPQNRTAACESSLGNPGITWETARKQNYGVDLRLFGDRLEVSADYFYEFRDDILTNPNTVPSYVAAGLPAVNLGQVENRGFEAEIMWRQQLGDFFYSVSGNVSHARNEIVEMDEVPRNEPYQRRTGHPVDQEFGLVFDGYYSEEDFVEGTLDENLTGGELREVLPQPTWRVDPGFLKYKDLNGDGVLDEEDQKAIGYSTNVPEYMYNSTLEFGYKNLDLSMNWAAATHISMKMSRHPYRLPFARNGAFSITQWQGEGRWTPEKDPDDVLFPRLSRAAIETWENNDSDYWLKDASYLRLKNMEIGYTFRSLTEMLGMKNMRVYMNGYNLLTFSNLMDTYSIDPEQAGNRGGIRYPIMKVYNFGIQLDF